MLEISLRKFLFRTRTLFVVCCKMIIFRSYFRSFFLSSFNDSWSSCRALQFTIWFCCFVGSLKEAIYSSNSCSSRWLFWQSNVSSMQVFLIISSSMFSCSMLYSFFRKIPTIGCFVNASTVVRGLWTPPPSRRPRASISSTVKPNKLWRADLRRRLSSAANVTLLGREKHGSESDNCGTGWKFSLEQSGVIKIAFWSDSTIIVGSRQTLTGEEDDKRSDAGDWQAICCRS